MRKILHKIRSSEKGYKIASNILGCKIIANNCIYQHFYKRKINQSILKLEGKMPSIDIGITNLCNADCIMCPHRNIKKFGTMKMNLYKKIIDDVSQCGIESVNLSFFGEAMLDKTLIDKIIYAKSKNLKVGFFTNAALMFKDKSKEMIDAGIDRITVSMDSNDKKIYEKIRVNCEYNDVKKNILDFLELRKKSKKKITVSMVAVLMDENYNNLKEYHSFWGPKVDSINLINMENRSDSFDKKSKKSLSYKKGLIREPCPLIWEHMVIDWDGKVVLCCNDYLHEVVVGDLNKETIKDVWFGNKINMFRSIHKKSEFKKLPFCDRCNKRTIWWLR